MSRARHRLLLHGAGRMGEQVVRAFDEFGFELVAVVGRSRPDFVDPALYHERLEQAPAADVVIDFTLPSGLATVARWCAVAGVPLVSGTTGLDDDAEAGLVAAAVKVPVLHAPNFSVGVNLALLLVAEAARRLGPGTRAHVLDVHHVHKKDAPSGTALALQAALTPLEADIESRREGEVVGEHEVRFELAGETLSVGHRALDRGIFARGALEGARWLLRQAPGRYTAQDWLRRRGAS